MIKVASDDETPLMMVWNTLALDDAMLELIAVVEETLPLTVVVMTFPTLNMELVVELATIFVRSVVVAMPLILLVRIEPLVESVFELITEEVAETPFTVVVRVLPLRDVERLLMKLVNPLVIPLTIEAKELVVVLRVFALMVFAPVVAVTPLTTLVSV